MFCNNIPLTGSHQAPAITASLQRQWVCVEVFLEIVRIRKCSWFSVSSYNPWFSKQKRRKMSPSTQRQQILRFANYIALRYIRAFPNFELNISSCVVKSFSRNNKHELTQRQRRQHITPLVFNWHQRPCKRSLGFFADDIMFYPEPKEKTKVLHFLFPFWTLEKGPRMNQKQ